WWDRYGAPTGRVGIQPAVEPGDADRRRLPQPGGAVQHSRPSLRRELPLVVVRGDGSAGMRLGGGALARGSRRRICPRSRSAGPPSDGTLPPIYADGPTAKAAPSRAARRTSCNDTTGLRQPNDAAPGWSGRGAVTPRG